MAFIQKRLQIQVVLSSFSQKSCKLFIVHVQPRQMCQLTFDVKRRKAEIETYGFLAVVSEVIYSGSHISLRYGANCILQVISSKVLNHILAAIFALI